MAAQQPDHAQARGGDCTLPRGPVGARNFEGSKAHRLTGSEAQRLTGSQAHRLTGSQAQRLTGSQAYRLPGSEAQRENRAAPTCEPVSRSEERRVGKKEG